MLCVCVWCSVVNSSVCMGIDALCMRGQQGCMRMVNTQVNTLLWRRLRRCTRALPLLNRYVMICVYAVCVCCVCMLCVYAVCVCCVYGVHYIHIHENTLPHMKVHSLTHTPPQKKQSHTPPKNTITHTQKTTIRYGYMATALRAALLLW